MKGQGTRRRKRHATPTQKLRAEVKELRAANAALRAQVGAVVTVTLKEWDWDAQNFVEVEYPYHIIKGFVDDLRNKKQWIEDTTSQKVWRRFQRFQELLMDERNKVVSVADLAPAA